MPYSLFYLIALMPLLPYCPIAFLNKTRKKLPKGLPMNGLRRNDDAMKYFGRYHKNRRCKREKMAD